MIVRLLQNSPDACFGLINYSVVLVLGKATSLLECDPEVEPSDNRRLLQLKTCNSKIRSGPEEQFIMSLKPNPLAPVLAFLKLAF